MNEKELIQTLFLPLASGFEGSLGLMDDAAVIGASLQVSLHILKRLRERVGSIANVISSQRLRA